MSAISYNGWPASKEVESIRIKSYPIKGTKIKLRCADFYRFIDGAAWNSAGSIATIDGGTP